MNDQIVEIYTSKDSLLLTLLVKISWLFYSNKQYFIPKVRVICLLIKFSFAKLRNCNIRSAHSVGPLIKYGLGEGRLLLDFDLPASFMKTRKFIF